MAGREEDYRTKRSHDRNLQRMDLHLSLLVRFVWRTARYGVVGWKA